MANFDSCLCLFSVEDQQARIDKPIEHCAQLGQRLTSANQISQGLPPSSQHLPIAGLEQTRERPTGTHLGRAWRWFRVRWQLGPLGMKSAIQRLGLLRERATDPAQLAQQVCDGSRGCVVDGAPQLLHRELQQRQRPSLSFGFSDQQRHRVCGKRSPCSRGRAGYRFGQLLGIKRADKQHSARPRQRLLQRRIDPHFPEQVAAQRNHHIHAATSLACRRKNRRHERSPLRRRCVRRLGHRVQLLKLVDY